MSLLQLFKTFVQQEKLFSSKDRLLLAISGGLDSVVLCELCKQAGLDFVMAHCNFQLRGEESERDEQLVRSLAKKYGVPVLVKKFDTTAYASTQKVSIQVAARELRYSWFSEMIGERETSDVRRQAFGHSGSPAQVSGLMSQVLTAHHLDDNIETMLMNFFKGTGIAGLRGMLPKQPKIIRPLLFAKKAELLQFAEENKLDWAEDSSNQSDKYTRNYFRHQLLPLIQNIYPGAENNLAHNLLRFRDIECLYQQSIDQHKKKLLEHKGPEILLPVLKLQKTMPLVSVLYEIIKDYGFSSGQVDDAIALLQSETGRYIQSATHRIIRNRQWLIISPVNNKNAVTILIEDKDTEISFEAGILKLQSHSLPDSINAPGNVPVPGFAHEAWLDAREIRFPLLLRKWKAGDYFYPLGMQKKKKLARFFIDQKLSKTEKEKIWVLESNKKIIWILGQRMDDRFKIRGSSRQQLRLQWIS